MIQQEPASAAHLDALENVCTYIAQQPSRCASSQALQGVRGSYLTDPEYQDIREGVIFSSAGWGWRLRRDWREELAAKRAALNAGSARAG